MRESAQRAEPALETKCKSERSKQAEKGDREESGVATRHPNHRNQNGRGKGHGSEYCRPEGTRKRPAGQVGSVRAFPEITVETVVR